MLSSGVQRAVPKGEAVYVGLGPTRAACPTIRARQTGHSET
jgi:hypothetical protein